MGSQARLIASGHHARLAAQNSLDTWCRTRTCKGRDMPQHPSKLPVPPCSGSRWGCPVQQRSHDMHHSQGCCSQALPCARRARVPIPSPSSQGIWSACIHGRMGHGVWDRAVGLVGDVPVLSCGTGAVCCPGGGCSPRLLGSSPCSDAKQGQAGCFLEKVLLSVAIY